MNLALRFIACFLVNIALWAVPIFAFGIAFHPLVSLVGSALTMIAVVNLSFVAIPE